MTQLALSDRVSFLLLGCRQNMYKQKSVISGKWLGKINRQWVKSTYLNDYMNTSKSTITKSSIKLKAHS
jgi:hypothetical protein